MAMRWKVLVTAPYMKPEIDRFRPVFKKNSIKLLVPSVKERCEEEDLLQWIADIDGARTMQDRIIDRTDLQFNHAGVAKLLCQRDLVPLKSWRAHIDRDRTLRVRPQGEARDVEEGRLFLDAAGVGDHDCSLVL